jgi:hypothetical protein
MNLEDALRDALRREEPPAGFEKRALNRIAQRQRTSMARNWMAIAAMIVLGALLFGKYQVQRQQTAREAGNWCWR